MHHKLSYEAQAGKEFAQFFGNDDGPYHWIGPCFACMMFCRPNFKRAGTARTPETPLLVATSVCRRRFGKAGAVRVRKAEAAWERTRVAHCDEAVS